VLGLVFGWGAPMGYAAATGKLEWPALLIYLAAIFWILGYDTIYAHQDREDDALIGVKSTARLFGANTRLFLIFCYSATILLLAAAMRMEKLSYYGVFALLLPAALLARQIVNLDIDNPEICLRLFKSNREVGLAVAAAILIGQI
jgi:4-hydroxybenzoate polyprenyltransferase